MRKHKFAIFLIALAALIASALTFASHKTARGVPDNAADAQLRIVATIFPLYDFARAVTGDRAALSMLVRPGTEMHSFEPSPQDIIAIRNADIFIYVGGPSDAWVDRILESIDTSGKRIMRMVDYVETVDEETVEGMQPDADEADGEGETPDEHIWTSPSNAIKLVRAISNAICEADETNAEFYQTNARSYISAIGELDEEFRNVVETGARNKIVFGERFPFRYFADAYGLVYSAAFPGCSTESDASAATMAYLVRTVVEEKLPVVYTLELSNGNIARAIAGQTGAEVLTLHSCHNLTKSDFESGATYISIMKQNAQNLRKGLN
jgi:zinc transport system substrate-binding protein